MSHEHEGHYQYTCLRRFRLNDGIRYTPDRFWRYRVQMAILADEASVPRPTSCQSYSERLTTARQIPRSHRPAHALLSLMITRRQPHIHKLQNDRISATAGERGQYRTSFDRQRRSSKWSTPCHLSLQASTRILALYITESNRFKGDTIFLGLPKCVIHTNRYHCIVLHQ